MLRIWSEQRACICCISIFFKTNYAQRSAHRHIYSAAKFSPKIPIIEEEFLAGVVTHLLHSDWCLHRKPLLNFQPSLDMRLIFRVVLGSSWEVVRPRQFLRIGALHQAEGEERHRQCEKTNEVIHEVCNSWNLAAAVKTW